MCSLSMILDANFWLSLLLLDLLCLLEGIKEIDHLFAILGKTFACINLAFCIMYFRM